MFLLSLAGALQARFEWTGTLADPDQAVTACRDADRGPSGLGRAAKAYRDAVAVTFVGSPGRFLSIANLGNTLRIRFERTGMLADLDEAVTVSREAVSIALLGDSRGTCLSNLGNVLRIRFESQGALADVDETVAVSREALEAIPVGHPNRVVIMSNLGNALQKRFERTRVLKDLDGAVAACRDAASDEAASPRVRAWAARRWGEAAATGGRWLEAVAGYEAAIAQLGRVASRSLVRRDQEDLLLGLDGLASRQGRAVSMLA